MEASKKMMEEKAPKPDEAQKESATFICSRDTLDGVYPPCSWPSTPDGRVWTHRFFLPSWASMPFARDGSKKSSSSLQVSWGPSPHGFHGHRHDEKED